MRSRLEAKWACAFDLLGRKWLYEPFELEGYIPDFLVDNKWLVECRPTTGPEWYKEAYSTFLRTMSEHAYSPVIVGSGGFDTILQVRRSDLKIKNRGPATEEQTQLWRTACSAVQWRPRVTK